MFKIFALFLITIVKLNVAQIPSTSTSLNVPKTTIANANQTPPTTTAQLGKCAYNIDAEIVATTARNQTAGSFGQCCSLCLSDPQCVAWTYVVKTNECQIKKDLPLTRSSVTRCYGSYSGFGYQYQYYPQYQYQFPYYYYAPVYPYPYPVPVPSTTPITTTTTTIVPTTRSAACFVENNVNYPGADITGTSANFNVASAGDCCNLCGNTAGCVGFAYDSSSRYCYLKGIGFAIGNGTGQPYPGMISGILQSTGK